MASLFLLSCSRDTKTSEKMNPEDSWAKLDQILQQISAPEFPDQNFNILDYGAVADGTSDCLSGFKEAIQKCNEAGGGRVWVPAGSYFVKGPIHLKSGVNLHVEAGAFINFSTDPNDFLPVVKTRWEGVECYNYSPLIYAYGQENIALTGKGEINGMASTENWWTWCGKEHYGWQEGMPSQREDHSRPKLFDWNTREVALEERQLGAGSYLRPNFIQFYDCKNILIEDITIRNSPMWIIHPVLSENITIQGVTVISHGPNSDGCDPEACKNVLIKNCHFNTGDDCIALKSGRNQDGRRIGRAVENIVIQDCEMRDGHGGVVIGSEVSGGARNIFAENCTMDSPNLDRAIRVKTNKVRGGKIENLFFRNIEVGEVKGAIFRVNMRYPIYSDPDQFYIPEISNISIENVNSKKSKHGILIDGYDDEHPVRDIILKNCRFDGVKKGNDIEFADNLRLENVFINGVLTQNE